MEKQNAKQFPKAYYAKHMQAGLCGYKTESVLIEADQMKEMAPSFVGKPIYVGHQKVDLDNLKQQAAGYISDSFYNELDGWLWVKFVVIDDEAHDAIQRGWAVSNAYIPTLWDDKAGAWHNLPYDRRIMAGEFTHLAIVDDPRYEGACILSPDGFKSYQADKKQKLNELTNKKEPKTMFSFFKNTRQPVTADKIDADTLVELEGGKVVSVQEMINSVTAEKKNAEEETPKAEDEKMNSEVEVGDEKMSLKELISRYNDMKSKKNAADSEEDKAAAEAKAAEEAKAKAEAEKTNAKEVAEKAAAEALENAKKKIEGKQSFEELKNAHTKAVVKAPVELGIDQLARGKARYGSNG